ncbi:MAG TPA: P1 family peptidase [Halanaerobiales bacterium]|nr:P1 family peptidase [Halanaerobiales bacterium]
MEIKLNNFPQVKVGNYTDKTAGTGCTVALFDKPLAGSVSVMGGGPGSRELALLEPTTRMDQINAVLLTGGSAFGLSAADGVMQYLEENNIGFDTGIAKVPIVPAGVIFDLNYKHKGIRPSSNEGYYACSNADNKFTIGAKGVGTGATCGKLLGMDKASKSGLGYAESNSNEIKVSALTVCNAVGNIVNPANGEIIAGIKGESGYISYQDILENEIMDLFGTNTTLGVVITNVKLSKAMLKKVAEMSHDGLARTVNPVHTMYDGDMIFVFTTNQVEADINKTGVLAAKAVSDSILNGIEAVKNEKEGE